MSTASSFHRKLFAIWMSTAPVLLMANPWGRFDWVELTASIGPCTLGIDRRIHPLTAAAIGLLALPLLAAADGDGDGIGIAGSIPRIAAAAIVFLIGLRLADRARDELDRSEVPRLDVEAAVHAARGFERRLEREFGRARRHGRGLALLSITARPRRAAGTDARVAGESDALETVREQLARELRLYADIVVEDGRVLALVPEVESTSFDGFVARVRRALEQGAGVDVEIGAASFPKDALCVEALIEAADQDRALAKPSSAASRPPVAQREEEA